MKLQEKIEELITQDADDFEVSKLIREEYKLYLSSLESIFEESQGKNFLVKHTKSIDRFLKIIYKYTIRKYFGDYSPMHNALPISLLALGSYGREQLCVYSDIDLMIVYKDIKGYNSKEIIESLLNMAWDIGLKLGHRVHEVSDLLAASRSDHTIKTAMIEARFIYGSKFIWMETEGELGHIRNEEQKTFIETKIAEYHERHKKFPIEMRANIKEGAGGIRDVNAVYWITTVLYHIRRVHDLVPQYISEEEYASMMENMEFIFRLRAALHLTAKKKQDTLILEMIPDVANMFKLSQRRLAEKTYKALVTIETLADIFIWRFTVDILDKPTSKPIMIDAELYRIDDTLYTKDVIPTTGLLDIIQKVLENIDTIKEYDISFIAYLQHTVFSLKNSEAHYALSRELFYHDKTYKLLIALYRAKLLTRFFPPLAKVKFLPQFDGYHRYPVDLHSMHTIRALQNINDHSVLEVYQTFNEEEKALLRLTTFLHDCGKGRKKDHSQLGATMVKHYSKLLGFSEEMANYAHTLVSYHTLMSNISAREDIYNEKVVFVFTSKIKKPIVLKLLYVLTYADVESVKEGAYSSFNAGLLKKLYDLSLEAFSNEMMVSEAGKRTKKEQQLQKYEPFNALKRLTQKRILEIQSNLLFFKYTPSQITALASWMEAKNESHEYKISQDLALKIEMLTADELNVGYLLGKLSNLDIAAMDIFAVGKGEKYFKIEFLENIESDDIPFIQEIIENAFDMQKKTKLPSLQIKEEEIDINCEHSNSYARMKVNCKDQKGLIANIITIFDDMDIDIASAKIQTIKNRARNLFLIEKDGQFCASKDTIINKLTKQG